MAYTNGNRTNNGARKNFNRNFNRNASKGRPTFLDAFKEQNPEISELSNFIRTSHEFKRHTALALIKLHQDAGDIDKDDKVYITFSRTHYTIKVDHLGRDMTYNSEIVLKAFLAALYSVVNQGNKIANNACIAIYNEPLKESVFSEEKMQESVKALAEHVINHVNTSNVIVEENN